MGVDIRIAVGVGAEFKIEELNQRLVAGLLEVPLEEVQDYLHYPDEWIYKYLEDKPLFGYDVGGSYMDGDLRHVISVKRLTNSYGDPYETGGGLYGLDRAVLTLEESVGLRDILVELTGAPATPGQFVALTVS